LPAFGARPFAGLLVVATLLGTALGASRAEPATIKVTTLTLINADTGTALADPFTGGPLDLAALPTRNLSIRANTSPSALYQAGIRCPHQSWREMHQGWMFSIQSK